MKLERIAAGLALRVTGLPLEDGLDEAAWAGLWEAWQDTHCLVFPGQQGLSVEAHVALLERFGPTLEERVPGEKHCYVTNALGRGTDEMNEGYRWGELTPHMDFTYTPYPADVISLFAEKLPATPTHTLFYSNVAPLAKMAPALRRQLAGYTIRCAHDLSEMKPDARLCDESRVSGRSSTQFHDWPLIRRHPQKPGLDVLFCTLQQTERILELSDEARDDRESRELLHRIFDEALYVEENCYEHTWRTGDLVVWDNCAMQHARRPIVRDAGDRVLRRVSVCAAGNGVQASVDFLKLGSQADAYA